MGNISHDANTERAVPIYRKHVVLPLETWVGDFPTV